MSNGYSKKLKITKDHYDYILGKIDEFFSRNGKDRVIEVYETGKFSNSDKVKDLNKRFRWDLLRYSVTSVWICDNLYGYMNDDHIDSALKCMVESIERKY